MKIGKRPYQQRAVKDIRMKTTEPQLDLSKYVAETIPREPWHTPGTYRNRPNMVVVSPTEVWGWNRDTENWSRVIIGKPWILAAGVYAAVHQYTRGRVIEYMHTDYIPCHKRT